MRPELSLSTLFAQATAHGSTDGLVPGSAAYWKALQPHRKLDQVLLNLNRSDVPSLTIAFSLTHKVDGIPSQKHYIVQSYGDGNGIWGAKKGGKAKSDSAWWVLLHFLHSTTAESIIKIQHDQCVPPRR
jgi:hypothetical protein